MTVDQMIERIETLGSWMYRENQWDAHRVILTHGSGIGHAGWNVDYGHICHTYGETMEKALSNLLEMMEKKFDEYCDLTEYKYNRLQEIKRGKEK
jgi:hypothetical protein